MATKTGRIVCSEVSSGVLLFSVRLEDGSVAIIPHDVMKEHKILADYVKDLPESIGVIVEVAEDNEGALHVTKIVGFPDDEGGDYGADGIY